MLAIESDGCMTIISDSASSLSSSLVYYNCGRPKFPIPSRVSTGVLKSGLNSALWSYGMVILRLLLLKELDLFSYPPSIYSAYVSDLKPPRDPSSVEKLLAAVLVWLSSLRNSPRLLEYRSGWFPSLVFFDWSAAQHYWPIFFVPMSVYNCGEQGCFL